MRISKYHFRMFIFIMLAAFAAGAQTFPPVITKGPFPKGTETRRNDAPIDSARPSSPAIFHEYTCYKVKTPPVIDGTIDSTDSVWSKIPWTLMTFWEAQSTERTIAVFSNDTTDTWKGPKDCTAWFKILWDDTNIYVAVKVYDDILNAVTDTADLHQTDCRMYQHDCIQFSFNSTPPDTQVDLSIDPYMGCELGIALATVFPPDTIKDTLDTTMFTIVPDTTKTADTTEAFTFWQPTNSNAAMSLASGTNKRSNSTVNGKAIHASVEKTADYYITRYEMAFKRNDSAAGYLWSPYIRDNAPGRFSIMAMDHDSKSADSLESICWASGILTKNFNKFGSILWSYMTPDGEEFRTGVKSAQKSTASSIDIPKLRKTTAWIDYTVGTAGHVHLDLFDCAGKKVVSLVNSHRSAGTYRVCQSTTSLLRGTYFYRLKTSYAETIRKVTMVK